MPKAAATRPKKAAATPYDKPKPAAKTSVKGSPWSHLNNQHFKVNLFDKLNKKKEVRQCIDVLFGPTETNCRNKEVMTPDFTLRSGHTRLMGIYKEREGGKPDRAVQLINIDMDKLTEESRAFLLRFKDDFPRQLARQLWDEAAANDKVLEFKNKAIEQVRSVLGHDDEDKAFESFFKERVHMRNFKQREADDPYARPKTGDDFDLIDAHLIHDLFSPWGPGLPAHAAQHRDAETVRKAEAETKMRYQPVKKLDQYKRPSDRFLARGDRVAVKFFVNVTATDMGDISVKLKAKVVQVKEEGTGGDGGDDGEGFEAIGTPPPNDGDGFDSPAGGFTA